MKYLIYGVGSYGHIAYETLKNVIEIVGFADTYKKTTNFNIDGLPIYSPNEINKDYISIIASGQQYWKEIEDNLDILNLKHITFDKFIFDNYHSQIDEIESFLHDDLSKRTLREIIHARSNNDYSHMHDIYSDNQYFAIPEVRAVYGTKESYVDAGAYVGDTVEKYIFDRLEIFDKIYAFEPAPIQYNALLKRVSRLKDEWALEDDAIQCIQAGLSDKNKHIKINNGGNNLGSCFVTETTLEDDNHLLAYSLDEFLCGKKVGFIKADIEGEEINLLKGAKETIKNHRPRLAICLYHNPYDFIQIPKYIKEICPAYKMVIRHHSLEYNETVLYCYI